MDSSQMNVSGSESDCISDELITRFEIHDDVLEDSAEPDGMGNSKENIGADAGATSPGTFTGDLASVESSTLDHLEEGSLSKEIGVPISVDVIRGNKSAEQEMNTLSETLFSSGNADTGSNSDKVENVKNDSRADKSTISELLSEIITNVDTKEASSSNKQMDEALRDFASTSAAASIEASDINSVSLGNEPISKENANAEEEKLPSYKSGGDNDIRNEDKSTSKQLSDVAQNEAQSHCMLKESLTLCVSSNSEERLKLDEIQADCQMCDQDTENSEKGTNVCVEDRKAIANNTLHCDRSELGVITDDKIKKYLASTGIKNQENERKEILAKETESERIESLAKENERKENLAKETEDERKENLAMETEKERKENLAMETENERIENLAMETENERIENLAMETENERIENLAMETENERIENLAKETENERKENLAKEIKSERIANLAKEMENERKENLAKETESERIENLAKETENERKENLAKETESERIENLAKETENERKENLAKEIKSERIANLAKEMENERKENLAKETESERIENLAKETENERKEKLAKETESERIENLAKEIENERIENLVKETENERKENLAKEIESERIANLAKKTESERIENLAKETKNKKKVNLAKKIDKASSNTLNQSFAGFEVESAETTSHEMETDGTVPITEKESHLGAESDQVPTDKVFVEIESCMVNEDGDQVAEECLGTHKEVEHAEESDVLPSEIADFVEEKIQLLEENRLVEENRNSGKTEEKCIAEVERDLLSGVADDLLKDSDHQPQEREMLLGESNCLSIRSNESKETEAVLIGDEILKDQRKNTQISEGNQHGKENQIIEEGSHSGEAHIVEPERQIALISKQDKQTVSEKSVDSEKISQDAQVAVALPKDDIMINEVTSSKSQSEDLSKTELVKEQYGDKETADSEDTISNEVAVGEIVNRSGSCEPSELESTVSAIIAGQTCVSSSGQYVSANASAEDHVAVRKFRKPLAPDEAYFVKMGMITESSVRIKPMDPRLMKEYTLGRIRFCENGKDVRRHFINASMRKRILQELTQGKTLTEVSFVFNVSRSTVGRIRQEVKERKRKALQLSSKINNVSKRALTFSTRVKIMGKLERGVSIEALSHEYGISKSTLNTLRRLKNQKLKRTQSVQENSGCSDSSDSPVKAVQKGDKQATQSHSKKLGKNFKRPNCMTAVLMALVIQNTESKSLTYLEIKRLLSFLFPYYHKMFNGPKWRKNLWSASTKTSAKKFFLKPRSVAGKDKDKRTTKIELNPKEEAAWRKFVEKGTRQLRSEAEDVMRRPELLESLLLGIVRLDTWNITDEDLKAGVDVEEQELRPSSNSFADCLQTSVNGVGISQGKKQGNINLLTRRRSLEQGSVVKRICESPSEQPSKCLKTSKLNTGVNPTNNQKGNGGSKAGIGMDISETFVNNRLVDLLMGKESQQSENAKAGAEGHTFSHIHGGSSKCSELGESGVADLNSSVVADTGSFMTCTNRIAEGVERNHSTDVGYPLTSSQSQQEKAVSLCLQADEALDIKEELFPQGSSVMTPKNEEGSFGRIVSVEDRAYHIWSSQDLNSPERVEPVSPPKGRRGRDKTFGKSLLSMARKGGAKAQKGQVLPNSTSTGDDQTAAVKSDSGVSSHSSTHSMCNSQSPPPQNSTELSQTAYGPCSCAPSTQNVTAMSSSPKPLNDLRMCHFAPSQRDSSVSHSHYTHSNSSLSQFSLPQSVSGHTRVIPPQGFSAVMGPPQSRTRDGAGPSQSRQEMETSRQSAVTPQESTHMNANGPVFNMNVCRPLSTWTPTPQQNPQRIQGSKRDENSPVPEVSSCVKTWQEKFPWMYYIESERAFICEICEWQTSERKEIEVFRLKTSNDVYLVAGQLRKHGETKSHRTTAFKKDRINELFIYSYPVLKGHLQEITGLDDIIKTVTDLAGGKFPGPQESPQKEYFMTYMIKHIAECVEDKLLESLMESPFFSVITVRDKDYSIIRWLNKKGESEEHFFCSQIGYPGEFMSCLTYLKRRKVNMKKLISYSILSNMVASNMDTPVMLQVPVRYPPLSICLEWLDKTSFLKNLFQQLSVLTKLIKSSYHKFAAFPEAADFVNLQEPYSQNCIINGKIMNFFFGNSKILRKIALDIYNTTGNMEAFGFSALELQDSESLMRCAYLLTKLHSIMSSQHSDSHSLCSLLKEFRTKVCKSLSAVKQKGDEHAFLSLIDIFVSHVMLTLLSPGREITNIFSKKLRHLSAVDLEKIFPNLMSEYQESSSHCLEKLHALRVQLAESRDCSLLQLLAILVSRPELSQKYPELYILYQKITVLPFLHAHVEQCMFNVAAAEVFLSSKVEKRLMLPVTMILLEGPSVENIDKNHIMTSWSSKWKVSNLHRNL